EECVGRSDGGRDGQVETLRCREVCRDTATPTRARGAGSPSRPRRRRRSAALSRCRIRRTNRRRRVKLIDGVAAAAGQHAPESLLIEGFLPGPPQKKDGRTLETPA